MIGARILRLWPALAVLALLFAPRAEAEETLRILTWQEYVMPLWVERFEQENNVKIEGTFVASNDEYMAKLAAGGADEYDIVTIASSLAQPAIRAGFVEPLDLALIPNYGQLFERFQSEPYLRDADGNTYGVPYIWAILPVIVNSDVYPEGNDFGILFDEKFKQRIAIWDDVNGLGEVASWMGFDDIWNLSDEQLAEVKAKMCAQRPLVRKYYGEGGEAIELFASGEIWAATGFQYITQVLRSEGHPIREFVADSSLGAVDSHFVVAGTPNRDLAHKFLNYLISAEVQGQVAENTGYSVTNPLSKDHMSAETWHRLFMDVGPKVLETLTMWEEIPRRERYLEVWNEIKACAG